METENIGPILKTWGVGAVAAVITFTGTFLLTEIDWETSAGIAAMVVPIVAQTLKKLLGVQK